MAALPECDWDLPDPHDAPAGEVSHYCAAGVRCRDGGIVW